MTMLHDHSQLRDHFAELLKRKRNYRQEIKDLVKHYDYIVFYGCGAIFNSIVDTWNAYVGRKVDYCCDSDSVKWGKYFCGTKCLSFQELVKIKNRSAVFITIGDFEPVFKNLIESGFPLVNQIYKYDLITSNFLLDQNCLEIGDKLCQACKILSDEQSKKVFHAIVNRVLSNGEDIGVMADVCEKNQYFPANIIKLSDHESFIDVGAFNGDTVKDFIKRVNGKFENIFSFEVNSINFRLLNDNVKNMPNCDRIRIFELGLWDRESDIAYSISQSQSTIGEGEARGHVVPLDEMLKNEKVTFIKMDIEGAELQALKGSKSIIKTQKPKLAICVYHDFKHLWEIPLYIKELVPEYKIYLRHHTKLEYETVCYAVL